MKETCLIIAGEKSGEEHAMSFITEMKAKKPELHFFGVGGDSLKNEGVEILFHLDEFSTWGVSEAVSKLPFYLNSSKVILEKVKDYQCRSAILIDFQTFNLKLAEKLFHLGVNIQYYVAPQAWAWKSWRTKNLARYVDTLYCIIPFEKRWFQERGVSKTISVNHPLKFHYEKYLKDYRREETISSDSPVNLLVLPGSRDNEVKRILPVFMNAALKQQKSKGIEIRLILVQSKSVNVELFKPYLSYFDEIFSDDDLVTAMKKSHICLAASGTVTLATALFSLPTIVGYAGGLLNTFIYENFISYRGFISLANIVHEREVFKELIAERFSSFNVEKELDKLLSEPSYYQDKVKTLNHTLKLISGDDIDVPATLLNKVEEAYES